MTRYLKQSYLPVNHKTLKSYTNNSKDPKSKSKINGLIVFFYFLVFTLPIYCRTVYITESVPQAIQVPENGNYVQIDLSKITNPNQTPQQYFNTDNSAVYNMQPDPIPQASMVNVNPPLYTHENHYTTPVNNMNQDQLVACSVDRIVGDVKLDQTQPPGGTNPASNKAVISNTSNTKPTKKNGESNAKNNGVASNNGNSTKAKSARSLINMGVMVLLHLITDCSLT